MTTPASLAEDLRQRIIAQPGMVLDDVDVIRALVSATGQTSARNVVDLRAVAIERLEAQLERLETTHRGVIAAAYENITGTHQIHRAILRMMEPVEFTDFLADLSGDVAEILRVDGLKLVLETAQTGDDGALRPFRQLLRIAEPGFVDDYLTQGRDVPLRQVTLRQLREGEAKLYGLTSGMRSEACLRLDFGHGRLPGLLALGSRSSAHFAPNQGVDLLAFFGGVFERAMRRWLA